MKPIRARLRRDRRGSVSVELALVSAFFLIPLTLGGWDGLFALAARYQTNAALHTLYYFAWSNPSDATNTADLQTLLGAINQTAIAPISLSTNYPRSPPPECLQPDGSSTATTSDGTCPTGTLETMVTYQITASVDLPFAIPAFSNPITLTTGGTVRIQ